MLFAFTLFLPVFPADVINSSWLKESGGNDIFDTESRVGIQHELQLLDKEERADNQRDGDDVLGHQE